MHFFVAGEGLILKMPITTAAEDKFCDMYMYHQVWWWCVCVCGGGGGGVKLDISGELAASRPFTKKASPVAQW